MEKVKCKNIIECSNEIKQKIDIKGICLNNDFFAINQKNYINDELNSETEYIITKDNVEKIKFMSNGFKNEVALSTSMPKLYSIKILDALRNKLICYLDIDVFLIKNPYTYLKQHNEDDVILLNFNNRTKQLCKMNGDIVPTAIYFDSLAQHLTDEYYDIDKVREKLCLRSDIDFLYFNNTDNNIIKEEVSNIDNQKKIIKSIVPFIWKPSDIDFKKYLDFYYNTNYLDGYKQEYINRYSFILNEIFGLASVKKVKH